jgi:hypothetical protein
MDWLISYYVLKHNGEKTEAQIFVDDCPLVARDSAAAHVGNGRPRVIIHTASFGNRGVWRGLTVGK